jgi:hypothetical protein
MAWQNAPKLNKLTAAQQSGNRGAQIWGVDFKGQLHTCYQTSPGGSWSDWAGGGWKDPKEPKAIYELAAAQNQPDGRVYFWALDMKGEMWARWQTSPGGNWSAWQHNYNGLPGANRPKKIAAVRAGGGHGQVLFAITGDGVLHYSYSILPAGNWSGWAAFPETPEKSRFIEVTACEQKDGRSALWALDTKRQLWGAGQEAPGGKWGAWNGPNWLKAPKLRNIAAVEGSNGAIIVGQDENYELTDNFQSGAGSNTWRGWSIPQGFDPRSYELTAAGQNNGKAQLWAITLGGKHTSAVQHDNSHWDNQWSDKDSDSDLPKPPGPKKK